MNFKAAYTDLEKAETDIKEFHERLKNNSLIELSSEHIVNSNEDSLNESNNDTTQPNTLPSDDSCVAVVYNVNNVSPLPAPPVPSLNLDSDGEITSSNPQGLIEQQSNTVSEDIQNNNAEAECLTNTVHVGVDVDDACDNAPTANSIITAPSEEVLRTPHKVIEEYMEDLRLDLQNKELRAEVESLHEENGAYIKDIKNLKDIICKIQKKNNETTEKKNNEFERQADELNEKENTIVKLSMDLLKSDDDVKDYEDKLNITNQSVLRLNNELIETQNEMKERSAFINAVELEKRKLEDDVEKLQEKVTLAENMQEKLSSAEAIISTLQNELQINERKLINSNENVSELMAEERNLKKELGIMEKKIRTVEKQMEALQTDNHTLTECISEIRGENEQIKNKFKVNDSSNSQCYENLVKEHMDFKNQVLHQLTNLDEKYSSMLSKDKVDTTLNSKKKKKKKKEKMQSTTMDKINKVMMENEAPSIDENIQNDSLVIISEEEVITDDELSSTSDESDDDSKKPKYPVKRSIQEQQQYQQDKTNNNQLRKPTGKNLLVFSTSITKGIDQGKFNSCYKYGKMRFQKWHGGRVRHIKHYIDSHLEEENPSVVIVQAGGNDLQTSNISIKEIVSDIQEICVKSRNANVSDIFIGGVTIRSATNAKRRGEELNDALRDLCKGNDYTFIDNSKITTGHLYDGVHLSDAGSVILANNYLNAMHNNFTSI